MQIEFVNHASVLIKHGTVSLLSDPWYEGPAFHKGWRLLVETKAPQVEELLSRTTHIWVSHEHPDHFSVAFFKRYGQIIRDRGITLLFQDIDDQRVADFLRGEDFQITFLPFGESIDLGSDVAVTCIKDEFIDSALSVRAGETHILNLNDCNVGTIERAQEFRDAVGPCDILLTQFSYAAWKGGRENRAWRVTAAQEKLDNVAVQAQVLQPKMVIPFASYVTFAHERNAYLNDASNTPDTFVAHFQGADFATQVMAPGDVTDGTSDPVASSAACGWWRAHYATATEDLMTYTSVNIDALNAAFDIWRTRVFKNNSRATMKFAQRFSPVKVLKPVVIELDDLGSRWEIDPPKGTFTQTNAPADLIMHSESLEFMFLNSFGFDTLMVSGTFEEAREGGFSHAARSIAIENLNNLGIGFSMGLLFNPKFIAMILERLRGVSAKIARKEA